MGFYWGSFSIRISYFDKGESLRPGDRAARDSRALAFHRLGSHDARSLVRVVWTLLRNSLRKFTMESLNDETEAVFLDA